MNNMEFFKQISRADILLGQSRYGQAEEVLERLFTSGFTSLEVIKMMIIAKMGLKKYAEAKDLCHMIMEQNPNEAYAFYILANINAIDRNFESAKIELNQAIELEPANSDFHAFMANLLLNTKDYKAALQSANLGLHINAENITALNARSSALVGLGKNDEAFATIDKSLATDPTNPYTHANMGWGLLHQGKSDLALEHFKTSLKEDPMHEYAKAGMREAIKSKFPVYKYFLMLMLALGKLKGKNQWIVVIVSYLALQFLVGLAENNKNLWPYLAPFIFIIVLFFISTWIFSPLMNLYLWTNKFGRYTLSEHQKLSAALVGASLLLSLTSFLVFVFILPNEGILALCIFSFMLMIPLGSMFNPLKIENRKKLVIGTIIISLLIMIAAALSIIASSFMTSFSVVPLVALIAYQWIANYILIRE